MLETLRSYLDKEEYYLIIMDDKIYIRNYQKLVSITNEEIILIIKNKTIKIDGINLYLTQSNNKELVIKGSVESIKSYANN